MPVLELKTTEYRVKGATSDRPKLPEKWWGRFAMITAIWTGAVLSFAGELSVATAIMPGWIILAGIAPPYLLWLYAALFTD